jgi:hypothetical protein
MHIKTTTYTLALLAAVLFGASQVSSTYARQSVSSDSSKKAHCVTQAMPLDTPKTEQPSIQCFDNAESVPAVIPQSSFIAAILWEHSPPGGRSLTIYSDSCYARGVSNLANYGFNDITSSLDNSCPSIVLYFDANYNGPQQSYGNGRTSSVGSGMNDNASSVLFP